MKRILVLLVILNLVNCNSIRRKFHYFMDMAYSPAIDSQEFDSIGMRNGNMNPPDNTIPYRFFNKAFEKTVPGSYGLDDKYITYTINGLTIGSLPDDHDMGSRLISSPLANNQATLDRGKERYNIYCSPCHGMAGKGDGPIKAKFDTIKAIARVTANEAVRAENWPVERLFLVMTTGINTMNSYASQVPEKDRWAIAHYVKKLQADARK